MLLSFFAGQLWNVVEMRHEREVMSGLAKAYIHAGTAQGWQAPRRLTGKASHEHALFLSALTPCLTERGNHRIPLPNSCIEGGWIYAENQCFR